eukprot:gnl/TRDRNA2_/TRDRNA2_158931_c4_seq1.p1 gnl/TRDRNA2_/TRDRNA2_158931_c4~~gnl/TRDRNA2_/TRDRNA2_158931_c4_seq1.p1  ORF type:complete len:326 (-),score=48.12 gnl/TRDRNA2_/TRDRNA2_158931_c4_seq1:79-936(-)
MTDALLHALPAPPPHCRALDFACGSGVIAAALARRAPTLRLHLLDADAVAIEAAKHNVPSAKRFFVSAGWPTHGGDAKRKRYDWIVSNPPVHRGQPNDFRVVQLLINGAPQRLRKHGILWMVAQAQVPIGCLLAHAGVFRNISTTMSRCGRFVVWCAVLGSNAALRTAGFATSAGEEQEPSVAKKKKRQKIASDPAVQAGHVAKSGELRRAARLATDACGSEIQEAGTSHSKRQRKAAKQTAAGDTEPHASEVHRRRKSAHLSREVAVAEAWEENVKVDAAKSTI